jgi:hypothetical protein
MTDDLVFRLLPEKRDAFFKHLENLRDSKPAFVTEYTSLKQAMTEAAFLFYAHLPKEEIESSWLKVFLKNADADAVSTSINKLLHVAPEEPNKTLRHRITKHIKHKLRPSLIEKSTIPYQHILYHIFVQYAVEHGFGEMTTENQLRETQKRRFVDLFKEPKKETHTYHNGTVVLVEDRPSKH